ncbi:hypothetical protein [Companilactobacillus bobalius]|uniref:hypothetical protein n=1 Tax=Companilactobacillus bobalius TaxID=2801451 RepID=UPI002D7F4BF6|nr:hypothetical protein [Companilactobacillus bobalius]
MKTLIKNAQLYYQGQLNPADLLVENSKFTQIAEEISTDNVQVIDAKQRLVSPVTIFVLVLELINLLTCIRVRLELGYV